MPEQASLYKPDVLTRKAAPKGHITATGEFYFTFFVTNSSFQDFIHMNAPPKDISPDEFSPLSIPGPFAPALYRRVGRYGARAADASSSHRRGPEAEPS